MVGRWLVLGLLVSCREPGHAPEHAPASAATPAAVASASSMPERVPPPPPDAAPAAPVLTLNGVVWSRGPAVEPAHITPTHGGIRSLNRLGDELRALAAECQCTSKPIELQLDEKLQTQHVLSRLGLLKTAGFTQVRVVLGGQAILFDLAEADAAPKDGSTLRVLSQGAFCSTTKSPTPDDLEQVRAKRACDGATLSVTEGAEWTMAWQSALALTHDREPRLRFVLDSQPRTPLPLPPPSKAIQPIGRLSLPAIPARVQAQYGDIYSCLVQFPVASAAAPALKFDIRIAANGSAERVDVVGSGAAPQTAACLRSVFQRMVFHAPNFGSARILYPFQLVDEE